MTFFFISVSCQLFPLFLIFSSTWKNWKCCLSCNVEGKDTIQCPQVKWDMYHSTGHWNALCVCVSLAFLAAVTSGQYQQLATEAPESSWTGRWMPHPPYTKHVDIHDREHAVRMGVVTTECDDAKVCINITVLCNICESTVCLEWATLQENNSECSLMCPGWQYWLPLYIENRIYWFEYMVLTVITDMPSYYILECDAMWARRGPLMFFE